MCRLPWDIVFICMESAFSFKVGREGGREEGRETKEFPTIYLVSH